MTHALVRLLPMVALLGCANASPPPAQFPPAAVPPAPRAEPTADSARPQLSHQGLVPVARPQPGVARTTIEGCLVAATEADAEKFPPRPATRSSPPAVAVAKVPGGIAVTHHLSHACCLKASVSTDVRGKNVEIREMLLGTPCRCVCASTVRTVVGLTSGAWEVSVDFDDRGQGQRVFTEALTLP